jgi:para-nitrobenzyl esterase
MKHHENDSFALRSPRRAMTGALVLGAWLAASTLVVSPVIAQDQNEQEDAPVVHTQEGPVRGFVKNGVYEFLGVAYAAPPVGALRWMPPQPVAHWSEPRNATKFGNTCPQVEELAVFAAPASITEDCLFLNVFTTRLGRGDSSRGLPVIVWIHGGGNVDGESSDYDGSKLATGGPLGTPTVVVTLNYRLNLFGFFFQSDIDAEGHLFGNYAVLDQQAVLQWVQRNAAAFGGDPTRVALGGQSAGASDTGYNMISPLAKGLFNRAIYESSPLSAVGADTTDLTRGTALAVVAGCDPPPSGTTIPACLRALTTAQILQLAGTDNAGSPYVQGAAVDGTIIPHNAIYAWTTGQFNHMPTMGGNVHDEGEFGIGNTEYFTGSPQVPITAAQYVAMVTPAELAQYPLGFDGLTPQGVRGVESSQSAGCTNRRIDALWAQYADNPVYEYEFDDVNAPYYYPPMPGFTPLAAHTIDIQFLFSGWHGGILGVQGASQSPAMTPQEDALSDQLVAAWTYFAATGNPNPGGGNSPWPRFVDTPGPPMCLLPQAGGAAPIPYSCPQEGVPLYLSENVPALSTFNNASWAAAHNCSFWDTITTFQVPN